jgi:hypothetical protein
MSRILVLATAFVSFGALAQTAPTAAPTAPTAVAPAAPTAPAAPAAPAPAAPPDTDVFVATLDLAAGKVGAPRNITARPGYDNQPAFLVDGSGLLFVMETAPGNTEVFRHDLASGANTALTGTAEAEYSPTPLADGSGFSAVRVMQPTADDGEAYTESQQLWRYGFDGKPLAPVHPAWKRVGYHAWIDDGRLALFLVGGGPSKLPHSLVVASVADGKQVTIARDIGRSLGRSPDGRVTFVDQSIAASWTVATMMPGDAKPTVLVATPKVAGERDNERSQDFCWLADGTLLMARGNRLLRFDPKKPEAGFITLAEFAELPGDIKRLAASRDGKHLAFVVDVKQPRTRGIRG